MHWPLAGLLLAALLGLPAGAAAEQQRGRLLQQTPQDCSNTASGRWFITDDRGMVCERQQLDHQSGCCTTGQQHSCDTCEAEDRCCSQYEHCVSCCLKPENEPEAHMHDIYRGRNKPETGHWETPFQYCQAVCRTTARSTQHENAFILDRKYCFSKLGRPHVPVPPAPPLPHSLKLVAGAAAQPCDAACAAKGMACKAEHFAGLNDCNSLRAKFMCEAGCGAAASDQREFPGYIEGSAPKHQRPAFCAVLPPFPGQAGPAFNCSQAAGSVRRLCPCEPLPAAAVAASQGAGGAEGAAAQQAAEAGDTAQQAAAVAQQAAAVQEAQAQQQQAAAQQQQPGDAAAQQAALQLGQQQQQQVQQQAQPQAAGTE
ncbi:hypothetical protein ABPG77_000428 [Micractinium sp. CCAP 211/92]